MTRATDLEEMYTVTGAVVQSSTGRTWKQERAMQGRPNEPYATLLFLQSTQIENQVVENADLAAPDVDGYEIAQVPWGTGLWECKAAFYRNGADDLVMDAAHRFASALRQEARFRDMWEIMGMLGGPRIIDISAIFRADNDARAEVRWTVYANVVVLPLADVNISEIEHQPLDITHTQVNGTETLIETQIDKTP